MAAGKWTATVYVKRRMHYLGIFSTVEEAAQAQAEYRNPKPAQRESIPTAGPVSVREEAVRAACADLGVIYQAVPMDGKDHPARVYEDAVSLLRDCEAEERPRWRRNEIRKGSIWHHEKSTVVIN